MHKSNHRRINCARGLAAIARHAGSARFAASMAWRTSGPLSEGTVPSTVPSAGLVTVYGFTAGRIDPLAAYIALLPE